MVSDERSEEFRRSVKESLSGPFQANRSDGTKPGIGIERKNEPTIDLENGEIKVYFTFFFSDAGFCAIRPVRLDRSAKAFLH